MPLIAQRDRVKQSTACVPGSRVPVYLFRGTSGFRALCPSRRRSHAWFCPALLGHSQELLQILKRRLIDIGLTSSMLVQALRNSEK